MSRGTRFIASHRPIACILGVGLLVVGLAPALPGGGRAGVAFAEDGADAAAARAQAARANALMKRAWIRSTLASSPAANCSISNPNSRSNTARRMSSLVGK